LVLLGSLARAAGTSDEEALRTCVLEPIEMHNTAITLDGELEEWLARGHDRDGNPVLLRDIPTLAGAGALRSDVRDMLRWLDANVGDPTSDLEGSLRVAQERRESFIPGGTENDVAIGLNWILQTWATREASGTAMAPAASSRSPGSIPIGAWASWSSAMPSTPSTTSRCTCSTTRTR
jgi:CubicO group peptidase (beta-lactamase class C family)